MTVFISQVVALDHDNDLLCYRFMMRKLFAYVRDDCKAEDQDAPSMHEVLLPGHVYLALLSVKQFYQFFRMHTIVK